MKVGDATIPVKIDMSEVLEGLTGLRDMCDEHLKLLEERAEALRLMAPARPEDWPTFPEETFLSVLRNVLQVKVSAVGNAQVMSDLLDKIARAVGLGDDWTPETLCDAVALLALPGVNLTAVLSTLGPPYEYEEMSYGAKGVPWRMGGKALKEFNDLQCDGWEVVDYNIGSNCALLRRSVNR